MNARDQARMFRGEEIMAMERVGESLDGYTVVRAIVRIKGYRGPGSIVLQYSRISGVCHPNYEKAFDSFWEAERVFEQLSNMGARQC